jgi:uncharacterized protein (UPF0332 family)
VFGWREFLILAKELAKSGDAASVRSAVSRAYYFAYNRAHDRATAKALPISRGTGKGSHEAVWEAYKTASWEVFDVGTKLRFARTQADYYANASVSQKDAIRAIQRAEKIVGLLAGV